MIGTVQFQNWGREAKMQGILEEIKDELTEIRHENVPITNRLQVIIDLLEEIIEKRDGQQDGDNR